MKPNIIRNITPRTIDIPIIFLTAKAKKYRKRALDIKFYAFLTKPYTEDQLETSIEMAILSKIQSISRKDITEDRIYIKQGEVYQSIAINTILFIKSHQGQSIIHTDEGKIVSKVTFSSFINQLYSSKLVRVNRSYVINIDKVEKITQGTEPSVIINQQHIKITKTHISDINQLFNIIRTKI